MQIKLLAAMSALALTATPMPVAAQADISLEGVPTDELAVARDIIQVAFPADEQDEIFRDMLSQVASQFSAAALDNPVFEEPGIRAIMQEFIDGLPERLMPTIRKHMPSMLEAQAVAYTRAFSLSELEDIRAFSRTETGARYFREATGLLADPAVAAANKAYFAEIQSMQASVQAEMQTKFMEYLAANPEVIERMKERREAGN